MPLRDRGTALLSVSGRRKQTNKQKTPKKKKKNFLYLGFLFLYSFLPYLPVNGTDMEIKIFCFQKRVLSVW